MGSGRPPWEAGEYIITRYYTWWSSDTNYCDSKHVSGSWWVLRHRQIKMQFLYLYFKHPNILPTSDVLGVIDSRKKIGFESSSEVCEMLQCLKCKYENRIFICRCLYCIISMNVWRSDKRGNISLANVPNPDSSQLKALGTALRPLGQ